MAGCGASGPIKAMVAESPRTFCNPVNVDYRFMKIDGGDGIREAADPVVVEFGGRYYLFASKSSGYWHTEDFVEWTHVLIDDTVLPIEDYAPGLFVYDGYLYYVGSTHGKGMLYRSSAPEKGVWEPVKEIWSYWDPAFLVEGDNLYLYYGCSPVDPIYMRTLDLRTLEEKRGETVCFNSDKEHHGWERTGEYNELERRPYIEGAWMTAHDGRYYLQYAAPGTEWKSYADGAYVATSPEGPFTYMENSPVSYKPTGFLGGAGHGCLFTVGGDNYWKAATNSISVRHMFERRVSFYPAGFDDDGYMYTDTYMGDYPTYLPDSRCRRPGKARPEWMLLSQGKRVTASSALDGYSIIGKTKCDEIKNEMRPSWRKAWSKRNATKISHTRKNTVRTTTKRCSNGIFLSQKQRSLRSLLVIANHPLLLSTTTRFRGTDGPLDAVDDPPVALGVSVDHIERKHRQHKLSLHCLE